MPYSSIRELIRFYSATRPAAVAISAPGGFSVTYGELAAKVEARVRELQLLGIERTAKVAVVLPNGPETALAILAVCATAVCAPLNPSMRRPELERALDELQPIAVVADEPLIQSLAGAFASRRIPIVSFTRLADVASDVDAASRKNGESSPGFDDVALVLSTSGTTSRPKEVPLTHGNLCVSAENVARSLNLTSSDRCLNIMPLFHIHGIVAGLLAPLFSGGTAICTPGFSAPLFSEWLEETSPTWLTAVPTMLQGMLERASLEHQLSFRSTSLRFIRSCSSALPPSVLSGLESVFGIPVVEAYGMTEAAHQIACNPLPPGRRKPGSVGMAAGPQIAILDAEGSKLPSNVRGEVAIRGPNVTHGYSNNPAANAAAFTGGWFRTGDEGYVDEDGYLFLTSRIKELINRGGEKIAPREVDEALLSHPAVQEAVAFALPEERLGETVAAAVVLKTGAAATEIELRRHCAAILAVHKVPERIVFVDAVPKGPTGKMQRVGLASLLGSSVSARSVDADGGSLAADVERKLAKLWAELLRTESVGREDEFLRSGGDSLSATTLLARLNSLFGIDLPIVDFFDAGTIAAQAVLIIRAIDSRQKAQAVQDDGSS